MQKSFSDSYAAAGVDVDGAQAADQAGGHVAGADEGNSSLAHVRSLVEEGERCMGQAWP